MKFSVYSHSMIESSLTGMKIIAPTTVPLGIFAIYPNKYK